MRSAVVFSVAGGVSGVLAKLIDSWNVPVATDLIANLGLWILVVTLISAMSPSWKSAVSRVIAYLLGMLFGYFACSAGLFDYLPWRYAIGWLGVTLILGTPFALIAWRSKGAGWLPACSAAIPIGMLLFLALSSVITSGVSDWRDPSSIAVTVFNFTAGVTLAAVLPHTSTERLRSLVLSPVLAGVAILALRFVTWSS